MQRQIIALSGISNSGKTTTIGLAYRILAQEGDCILAPSSRATKETTAILEIDGVKVGFTSVGDWSDVLEMNLVRLIDAECMVIVCAAHTIQVIEQLADGADPSFAIEWTDKPREHADYDKANRQIANEIVAKVRKAIAAMAIPV